MNPMLNCWCCWHMAICCWPTEFLCCVNLWRNSQSISSNTGLRTHVVVGTFCSWSWFFLKDNCLMLKLEGSTRIYVKSQQKVPQLDLMTLGATSRISIHSITGIKLGRGLRRAYRLLLFCYPKIKRVRPSLKFTIGKENSRKTKNL